MAVKAGRMYGCVAIRMAIWMARWMDGCGWAGRASELEWVDVCVVMGVDLDGFLL